VSSGHSEALDPAGTGDTVSELDEAILAGRLAVDRLPPGDSERPAALSALAGFLYARFEQTGDRADIDAAVDAIKEAVDLTPSGHSVRSGYFYNLGIALVTRFEYAGDSTDLDAAIEAVGKAVGLIPPGDQNLVWALSNMGNALLARFSLSGDSADLEAAIRADKRALDLAAKDDPGLPRYLSNLGPALLERFSQRGSSADLVAAITAGRLAVNLSRRGDPELTARLSNLSMALLTRFEQAGDGADLDAAIAAVQRALDLTPPGDRSRANRLANLGLVLQARFEQAGDGADLDAAIDAMRQAADLTPPAAPDRAAMLSNLGNVLRVRSDRMGDGADLDAAIDAVGKAIELTPADSPDRAGRLSNLGLALHTRFGRTADGTDLDAAVEVGRQAVNLTRPGHSDLDAILSNLAISLRARFERTGDNADLDAAIDAGRHAVELTLPGHPSHPARLSNLGVALRTRFQRAGDHADLEAAIDAGRQAVDLTPDGHSDLAVMLYALGVSLRGRLRQTGDAADLDAAISCWRQASQMPSGVASIRLAAAQAWAVEAATAHRTHLAAEGFAAAVGLLQEVAWHGLERATREQQLERWAGLAAEAATYAILDNNPVAAVEVLEQGRSVLWAQALKLRTDLARLSDTHPDLAERLDSLRKVLDAPAPVGSLLASKRAGQGVPAPSRTRHEQGAIELRRRQAREWDTALARVRALDGFEHFLDYIPYSDLASQVAACTVVVLNASRYGCHALLVEPGSEQPRVVDLPGMNPDTTISMVSAMLRALERSSDPFRPLTDQEQDRRAVLEVLRWLWDVMAEPVLSALGFTSAAEHSSGDSGWPRVWWCPTGPLTLLPIHAAGRHPGLDAAADRHADRVLDRVISSYIPSLTALGRAREPASNAPVRQLAVGMPVTPGLPALLGVDVELEVVARHFPPGPDNLQLIASGATRANVLTAIGGHSWVHLACHASQQFDNPASSGFALQDGTLTVADLAALPNQQNDLAFLSACETAAGSARHFDEAIHLAAAMQFIGYRNVIATLWTIADLPAPGVADAFYSALRKNGAPNAAEALHHAVRQLYRSDPANPLLWAPYIHLGN